MSVSQNYSPISPSLSLDFANVKALDPRVTFARASGAVYYGTETAKAEENLLLRSQEIGVSPWSGVNFGITANTTTAPDGTTTAETYTSTAATTADRRLTQSVTTPPALLHTASVFLQEGTAQYAYIAIADTSVGSRFAAAVLDMSTGTITQTSNGADASSVSSAVVDFGGGWYRVSVTASMTGGSALTVRIAYVDTGTPTFGTFAQLASAITTAGTETFFLWGAQLEQR